MELNINPKFEIRNSKQSRMTKIQNPKKDSRIIMNAKITTLVLNI
mgnify:CR=1 FL=1|jgi:hypothetical protein